MGRLIILYAYLGIGPRLYIITEKVVLSSLSKNKDSKFRSPYLIIANMRGLLLTLGFLAVATATKNTNCTEGLYMIVARGSDEPAAASKSGLFPANSGSPGYLAQLIAAQIKGSKIMGVEYPATLNNYIPSENEGANVMLQLANDYHSSCPGSKMALLGYSQVCDKVCIV